MLAITETAATAIKTLTDGRDLPDQGGLRIAAREDAAVQDPGGLELSLAESPSAQDAVVDEHGAHVFLAPRAAACLDDKVLDAVLEPGRARFVVGASR